MNNFNETLREKAMLNETISIMVEADNFSLDFSMKVLEFYIQDDFYFLEDENDNLFQFRVDEYEYDYDANSYIIKSDDTTITLVL